MLNIQFREILCRIQEIQRETNHKKAISTYDKELKSNMKREKEKMTKKNEKRGTTIT